MKNENIDWSKVKHFFVDSEYGWRKSVLIESEGSLKVEPISNFEHFSKLLNCWQQATENKNIESFDYPIALIRKRLYESVLLVFFTIIGVMVVIFLLIFQPITDVQKVFALMVIAPWPILITLRCLIQCSGWRIFTNMKFTGNNLLITQFNGKVIEYSIDNISRCCFDRKAHNLFIHFKDGRKMVGLQKLSYAPVFLKKIESMIKETQNLCEKEISVRGGQLKCLVEKVEM